MLIDRFAVAPGAGTTPRVISSDAYHRERPDLIILAVTSQARPQAALGEAAVARWKEAGLLRPSVLNTVVATIERGLVLRKLGRLVTQEVFFTVFNALPSFDRSVSLLIFVFHITRNTVNRRLRRSTAARWWLSRTSGRNGAVLSGHGGVRGHPRDHAAGRDDPPPGGDGVIESRDITDLVFERLPVFSGTWHLYCPGGDAGRRPGNCVAPLIGLGIYAARITQSITEPPAWPGPEAVPEVLRRRDHERGLVVLVEGTQPEEVRPVALELHATGFGQALHRHLALQPLDSPPAGCGAMETPPRQKPVKPKMTAGALFAFFGWPTAVHSCIHVAYP